MGKQTVIKTMGQILGQGNSIEAMGPTGEASDFGVRVAFPRASCSPSYRGMGKRKRGAGGQRLGAPLQDALVNKV